MAEQAGLKSLGSAVNAIGPYQAAAGFVLRSWAKQNEELLVKYLQAYIEGVRWILDPANKVDVIRLLRNRLFLEKQIAEQTYEVAVSPTEGIVKDAAISLDGFRNVSGCAPPISARGAAPRRRPRNISTAAIIRRRWRGCSQTPPASRSTSAIARKR